MNWILGLLILVGIYLIIKGYRKRRGSNIRKHGHCCSECRVKELCEQYKKDKNIG